MELSRKEKIILIVAIALGVMAAVLLTHQKLAASGCKSIIGISGYIDLGLTALFAGVFSAFILGFIIYGILGLPQWGREWNQKRIERKIAIEEGYIQPEEPKCPEVIKVLGMVLLLAIMIFLAGVSLGYVIWLLAC